jgi:hypothetical protein
VRTFGLVGSNVAMSHACSTSYQVGTITRASTLWELPSTDVPLGAVARRGISKVEIAADATPLVASRLLVALDVRHIVRRTCDERSGVLQV